MSLDSNPNEGYQPKKESTVLTGENLATYDKIQEKMAVAAAEHKAAKEKRDKALAEKAAMEARLAELMEEEDDGGIAWKEKIQRDNRNCCRKHCQRRENRFGSDNSSWHFFYRSQPGENTYEHSIFHPARNPCDRPKKTAGNLCHPTKASKRERGT